jgi:ATPase subunit of ABC transporter with duplicated ATPase domains
VFNIVQYNYIEQFTGCKLIARRTRLYYNKLGDLHFESKMIMHAQNQRLWTRCELMSILTVTKLSHGFGDRAIFEDVSFRLLKGEHIGLIGANGEGKSTFMSIITGSLEPDAGKIEWSKRVRVGYLDQHAVLRKGSSVREVLKTAFQYLLDLETEMNQMYEQMGSADPDELERLLEDVGTIQDTLTSNDYYVIDAKVEEIARGLGLDEIGLDRDVHDLSGGQRTKVLLAKLLLEKPDILLLDEPTNYLDEVHIEWLRRYLQQYENAFILISHDIPFLNSVINLIYHVENRQLHRYTGDYDQFVELHGQKKAQLESAYKRQQQEIAELKDFVARNKARVSTRNMAMSRQKKLDKMELIELDKEKPKPQFHFKEARTSGKLIFETNELVIGYEEPLSKPLNLRMERGQKVAIVGANGIGKTTLLRSILGEIHSLSGSVQLGDYLEIGYFEQEVKGSNNQTCIEEIWNVFPSFSQFEVRAALARCGLTTQHIESRIDVLSGGEKAKVRLCKLINRESNLLVLDEPTNHLDVDAKNELKRALQAYRGSILLISHEPEFYRDIVTDIWNGESWTTKIF